MKYIIFILWLYIKSSIHFWLWIFNSFLILFLILIKKDLDVIVINLSLLNIYLSFSASKALNKYRLLQNIFGITRKIKLTVLSISFISSIVTIMLYIFYVNVF